MILKTQAAYAAMNKEKVQARGKKRGKNYRPSKG